MDDDHDGLIKILVEHTEICNSHDLERLMNMFTEDCIFDASGGTQVLGQRFNGKPAVRDAFAGVFEQVPDAQWEDPQHFVLGAGYGVSEWTFTGTLVDGSWLKIAGCCFISIDDGLITRRNSFRKQRPDTAI